MLKRHPWSLLVLLGTLFVLTGTALLLLALSIDPTPNMGEQLSGAGIGLVVAGLGGLIVTATFKAVDWKRELRAEQARILDTLIRTYNDLKTHRRRLRALGVVGPGRSMGAPQVGRLRETLESLSETQLEFESLARQLKALPMFEENDQIQRRLADVETYLNKTLVEPWEQHGHLLWRRRRWSELSALVPQAFIAPSEQGEFRREVAEKIDYLIEHIQAEMRG